MDIRKTGEWMCLLDERILEYLDDTVWSEPRLMAKFGEFNASQERIEERCRVLARVEFIIPAREGIRPSEARMWEISPEGARYLAGEVDAESRRPLPAPRPPEAIRPCRWEIVKQI